MRPMRRTTLLIVIFIFTASALADELYLWTDSKGVTHITPTPPPSNARHVEVIDYTPQTRSEIEAARQEREALEDRYEKDAILQNARNARREAEDARRRAAEAQAAADGAEAKTAEFKKKVGQTIRRQQLNRGTIERLEADAAAARTKALEDLHNAELAEKRSVEAEKKAGAVLRRVESGETETSPAAERANRQGDLGGSR